MTEKQQKIVLAVASVSIILALLLMLYYYFVTNVKKEDIDMYKFKYFTWGELTKSAKADSLGLSNEITSQDVRDNLVALVMKVLDPVRERYGASITVNSAYRSPAVNKAVGGASNSQHVNGTAADLTTGSKEGNKRLYEIIKELGNYDQLINEKDYSWIHVSYKRVGYNRKQAFNID